MKKTTCFHCGNETHKLNRIVFDEKEFCCRGCQTVYEIFKDNDLTLYYDFASAPGDTPKLNGALYDFLDQPDLADKFLDFKEDNMAIAQFYIPHIHCSSCIWILENLNKLEGGVYRSLVHFSEKKLNITFDPNRLSLKDVAQLLDSIGYAPYISLENYEAKSESIDRSLIYKIGFAFFSFGNVMLLSFPEYFNIEDYWIMEYRSFFRWLILLLSLPVFFYSASPYHKAAWNGIKNKNYTIDIPMSLGIIVMFVRSVYDIVFGHGQGFFDSMCMLVFFMLLGKLFQQRTYTFLSFERDYKSYFPIAVTQLDEHKEETPIPVYDIKVGDRLLIRNEELIPVDSILISERAFIDYSFVTGEAVPIEKKSGDKLFAGGKQMGELIEIETLKPVSQSYLTQLWSMDVFQKKVSLKFKTITDTISHYFTPSLLAFSVIALAYWLWIDVQIAFNVFTAILIVACPCALALSAPFTLGNVIRFMGREQMYLKNTTVVEQLAQVDTVVFDKTGTLTSNASTAIQFQGEPLTREEQMGIRSLVRGSNHPLSRRLYGFLPAIEVRGVEEFKEWSGKGLSGIISGVSYQIGSADFLDLVEGEPILDSVVHISIGGLYKGYYRFKSEYRPGMQKLFQDLNKVGYQLVVLSGDHDGERNWLESQLPKATQLVFNQKPEDKLRFIADLQEKGRNVMMVGDGLNDAGALVQSNVGVSISENVNVFTPASDAILDATKFEKLNGFLQYSKNAVKTIKRSYVLALTYNVVGLTFAVTNHLSPLAAAILMPISTITIISFVTIFSSFYAKRDIR